MSKCLSCGFDGIETDTQCPQCGSSASTITDLLDAFEAEEQLQTFNGRCKKILQADNIKSALLTELEQFYAKATRKELFVYFVIFSFVFALLISVL